MPGRAAFPAFQLDPSTLQGRRYTKHVMHKEERLRATKKKEHARVRVGM